MRSQVGHKYNTGGLIFLYYNQEIFLKRQFKKYLPSEDFAVAFVLTQRETSNLDAKLFVGIVSPYNIWFKITNNPYDEGSLSTP